MSTLENNSPSESNRTRQAFSFMFLGGMAVNIWLDWGPHSDASWNSISTFCFAATTTQFALYAWRLAIKESGKRTTIVSDGVFFSLYLAISLLQIQVGWEDAWWIFLVFLGLVFVAFPRWLAWVIAGIAIVLYVPCRAGWSNIETQSFSDWFSLLFPLAFPLVLGTLYRQLLDTNAERAQLIEELQSAKKGLELARDREGELATLRERERLARDLHDTLGHQLVTLTVQLEAAQRLVAVDPPQSVALLEEMQKLSRSSMDELRRALDGLRTSGLGERPLAAALQALCADAGQRFSIAVDCQCAAGADALPPVVAEVLWRVAQEGLTNVGQHAQARHVRMNLNLLPKEIILQVADDGVGLPPDAEDKPGHYGLRGLRERVEGLGGTFTLANAQSRGAVIEARLPIIT